MDKKAAHVANMDERTGISVALIKVNELLKEVRVDYTNNNAVEAAISAVRLFLLDLSDEEVSPSLAAAFCRDLGVTDEKACFVFKRPETVAVVGSYASHTVTRPVQNVDLAIRIPKACFHQKDFLNYRYHVRRALYLAHVEKKLRFCSLISRIEWSSFLCDARKPILILHPGVDEKGASTKFVLRLFPSIAANVFDIDKLSIGRNNVRKARSKEGAAQPTLHYNSSILEDMMLEGHSNWLCRIISGSAHLMDAILLLKVWLRQRNMEGSPDWINGFLMSMMVAHLSTTKLLAINNQSSALQIFRVAMEFFGKTDVLMKGVFMEQDNRQPNVRQTMITSFDAVICDSSGCLNLASRVTKSALAEFKEDASHTLETMSKSKDGGFDAIFMTPVDYVGKFDYHFRVDAGVNILPVTFDGVFSLDQERWRVYEGQVEMILKRALGERALLVRVLRRKLPNLWTPSMGLACVDKEPLLGGIILNNVDVALRITDTGPSADNKLEAKNFRAFWGSKADLRRFKDGSIAEAAVWETETWQRHLIIKHIVEHVLKRHLSLTSEEIHVVAGQLDFALLENGKDQVCNLPKLLEAYETLSKRLRSLEIIPLKVASIQPLSAALRHSAVYCPQPHPVARGSSEHITTKTCLACLEPVEVMVQLEGSGRWPDDPIAIQKTKIAFCIQIAESLQKLGGVQCLVAEDAVDLLMLGHAFRLCILYEKDPTLLNKDRISSSFATAANEQSKSMLNFAKQRLIMPDQDFLLRSLHSGLINGLYGLYPVYEPTVRLAKRWVGAHLFSGVLIEEAVELLVAYLFVRPAPFRPPSSRITGLFRFLQLLAKHDWLLVPLIVDVNGDLTLQDEELIMRHFDAIQQHSATDGYSGPAMFIATPYDMGSETWTRSLPSRKILKRLVAYARSSADLLGQLVKGGEGDKRWQSLFRTPLSCYDALVLLHHDNLPYPSRLLFPSNINTKAVFVRPPPTEPISMLPQSVVNGSPEKACNHLLVGFNPIHELIDDLKLKFGDSATFWYDSFGSDVIGLTMSTTLISEKKKGVKRKPLGNGDKAQEFMSYIGMVGDGLVRSVHLADQKRT